MTHADSVPASLPAILPSVTDATLPERYRCAQDALAECSQIDECKDWSDKMAALASYAKQAEDSTLEKYALRIRARAVRRCGELLKMQKETVGFATGGKPYQSSTASSSEGVERPTLADAGISHKFSHQAQQVAGLSQEAFDAAVDSDNPPSVHGLVAMARRDITGEQRDAFARVKRAMRAYALFLAKNDAVMAASGETAEDAQEVRQFIAIIDRWHDRFTVRLRSGLT